MSIKKNFLYSSILTVSAYLFPMLVYPYVSRVLGLSNIGIVNFVDNLINYFVLFSMMGIGTIGVREIAAVKSDKNHLSKVFVSLLSLTMVTTVLACIALLVSMYTIPTLFEYRDMLYVGLVKLVFNVFLLEWFFIGLEEFKYITKRTITIRFMYVASIFLFVHNATDYKIYFIITVAAVVMNALVNVFYARRFVKYSKDGILLKPYVKTYLIMGVYALLTNFYTMLNAVWLGFVTNTDEVGNYTTATKLQILIMGFLNSFASVVYPRVTSLLAQDKKEEYWQKITVALDAIYLFAFPTIAFVITSGPVVLNLLVGDGFEGAYFPLRIISPLVLIIGIEQILIIQILMAKHYDRIVLINSIVGAATMILANISLTSTMGASGSAIVWLLSETVIMTLAMIEVYKKEGFLFPYKRLARYCLTYIPLIVLSALICNTVKDEILMLACSATLVVCYTIAAEIYVLKNSIVLNYVNKLYKR